jgi:RNA recognition motif-containing protein
MAASDSETLVKARKFAEKAGKKKKSSKSTSKASTIKAEKDDTACTSDSPDTKPRKRKREVLPEGEIEININLPEPPSKKALRRAKKGKPLTSTATAVPYQDELTSDDEDAPAAAQSNPNFERSKYGVWVGNLPWSATKETLQAFITEKSDIADDQITRINMPPPAKDVRPQQSLKPQNKGFAYVDFSSAKAEEAAVALSETLMGGRRLLIKKAGSFEGRPVKDAVDALLPKDGKPPNNRIFVGNLNFDVTKEDITTHYAQCGEVLAVHMATFEDSGKCKGFAWVTFEELDAAKAAVIGWTYKSRDQSDNESDDTGDEDTKPREGTNSIKRKKKEKKIKWFVNKLHGRPLRVEFAEDAQTRYKKRYGGKEGGDKADRTAQAEGENGGNNSYANGKSVGKRSFGGPRREYKVDARTIAPGAANTNAQRGSAAIVQSKGKKTTFD